MSRRALMKAVRDLLRLPVGAGTPADGLGFAAAQCDIMSDGQPPPACGELYIAVHEGDWSSQYDEGREDEIGVEITVTRRVAYVPQDRIRVPLNEAADSLELECERIAAKIHSNYAILAAANTVIGVVASGFHRPLFFRGGGRSEPKGPEWFSADPNARNPAVGLACTLRFGGATRTQTIETQT